MLSKHAQPNIGCLQIGFAAALFFYALKGLGVWGDTTGVAVCISAAVVACAAGQVAVWRLTRGIPGGESQLLEPLADSESRA